VEGAARGTQAEEGRGKFWRNKAIEEHATARIAELERILGKPVSPPVPIDLLAEKVLGLDFLWEPIDERPGEVIFAGLHAKDRLIIMNEGRRDLFNEKPGLERSTKGHEMGHWDLFIDEGQLDHPELFPADESGPVVFRSTPHGDVAIIKMLMGSAEGRELLRSISARADDPDEARAVNRYAAAISMPAALIRAEALKINRTRWPELYRLAERFDVTISALTVRLKQLDLLWVGPNKELYESHASATGQQSLF